MKVPHWYDVQVSDTTMMPGAASLHGQKDLQNKIYKKPQSPGPGWLKDGAGTRLFSVSISKFPINPLPSQPCSQKGCRN